MSGISVVCRNWNLCFLEKKFKRTIDIIVFARIFSFKLHFFWWQIFWHTVQNWDAFFIFFFILAGRKPLFMNYLSCSLYPQTLHQYHHETLKNHHKFFQKSRKNEENLPFCSNWLPTWLRNCLMAIFKTKFFFILGSFWWFFKSMQSAPSKIFQGYVQLKVDV